MNSVKFNTISIWPNSIRGKTVFGFFALLIFAFSLFAAEHASAQYLVYAVNQGDAMVPAGGTVSVIDPATHTVVDTYSVSSNVILGGVSLTSDGSVGYFSPLVDGEIVALCMETGEVTNRGAGFPNYTVLSSDDSVLYAGDFAGDTIKTYDAGTLMLNSTPAALGSTPGSIDLSLDDSRVFVQRDQDGGTAAGFIDVYDPATNMIVDSLTTTLLVESVAHRNFEVTPDGSRIFALARTDLHEIMIDTSTDTYTFGGMLDLPDQIQLIAIAISPDGLLAYITESSLVASELLIVDIDPLSPSFLTLLANIPIPGTPDTGDVQNIAVSPDNMFVYIANGVNDVVHVFNTSTMMFEPDIPVGTAPVDVRIGAVPPVIQADLRVLESSFPNPVVVNQSLTYTAFVINNGPDDTRGATYINDLPAGAAFVSATPDQGSCSHSGEPTGGVVTCVLGQINNGMFVQVDIEVTAPTTPDIVLNFSEVIAVCADDPLPSNNFAGEITEVIDSPIADTLIEVSVEPQGVNCPNGGQRIEVGFDDNANGILEQSEIDNTSFVCDGAPGQAGANGLNSLVVVTDEPPGSSCADGGQRVDAGIDDNANGVLEAGEIDSTSFICDGADGQDGTDGLNSLTVVTTEPSGSPCANGGQMIQTGQDDNANGTLEAGEIDSTSFVCNGADGLNGGANSLVVVTPELPGTNCADGGQRIQAGQDTNANGILELSEIDSTSFVCNGAQGPAGMNGQDGFTSLVIVTPELPGTNCTDGGQMVETGVDDNSNGVLEAGEIDSTTFICDGAAGLISLVVVTPELPGFNCAVGGQMVQSGVDDNSNGALDPIEIDSTSFVCDGADGLSGGVNSLVVLTPELPGTNCPNGGQMIDVGQDTNGNGILELSEIDSTSFVCDGAPGQAGANGLNSLVVVTTEPGGMNCSQGGERIDVGIDSNENGVLDLGEILSSSFICNGVDGMNGQNGLTSLVVVTPEGMGSNCADGGQRVDSGLDDNADGILDPAEIDNTSFVCNGAQGVQGLNSLVEVTPELPGGTCANGGQRIDTGIDDNANGVLDAAEIDSTSFVCNGADGLNGGANSLVVVTPELPGTNCADGGQRIQAGQDTNANGILELSEIDSTSFVCNGAQGSQGPPGSDGPPGESGLASLVVVTPELPGSNCADGGQRVDSGLDDNSNGILEPAEIDSTTFVCNGAPGADGASGVSLINMTPELSGTNCTFGGIRVDSGIDDDSNGVLDPVEIDQTSFVCNGEDGDSTVLIEETPVFPGMTCPAGGFLVDIGLDQNGNDTLEMTEIINTITICNGVEGEMGVDSLLNIEEIEPDETCEFGGILVQAGPDLDFDGVLGNNEIASATLICGGATTQGSPGQGDGQDGGQDENNNTGGGGSCSIAAGPSSTSDTAANWALLLLPVAMVIGVRAIRRRRTGGALNDTD